MLERYRKLPIGKKLQLTNLAIVGLITLLTTINLSFYLYSSLLDEHDKKSRTISSLLIESLDLALFLDNAKVANEILGKLSEFPDVSQVKVYDNSGHLFAHYSNDATQPGSLQKLESSQDISEPLLGRNTQRFFLPIRGAASNQEKVGTFIMHMDLSDAYDILVQKIGIILLAGLFILVAISALLTKIQGNITRPLLALTDVMRKVNKGSDFSERADTSGEDEIGELSRAFNGMMEELVLREYSLQEELKERRNIEAKLSEIAHFDPVTALPNRHSFNNQIDRVLLNHKYGLEKFALMYVDLDNFKYVNDTFGHHLGDLLLARIGERMRISLRQADYVARLGGDEFVIIMSDFTSNSQISEVANKLLTAMQAPFTVEGREVFISASIGISIYPTNGKDSETLKRHADAAMYLAKKLGKDNFQFYQEELSSTQKNRISTETSLRRSIERDEISVYYQPIVEIESEKIIGFEALARWTRQDGVLIMPEEFIPLAEEIGLIIDIGKFVLDTATTQTAAWVNQFGLSFIAVNFSSRQFKQNDIVDDIFNSLKSAKLLPAHFEMEITESLLMDNTLDSMNLLYKLIDKGMGVAIDDFGTGYSSLSYITSFPISKIKIDQSFVAKLPDDKSALAVVTAITGLARSLKLKVVAEGIETREQLDCLTELGCQYGQGYLFSKPVTAIEATKLLESGNIRPV